MSLADTSTVSQTALPHQARPVCGSDAPGASADGIYAKQTGAVGGKVYV